MAQADKKPSGNGRNVRRPRPLNTGASYHKRPVSRTGVGRNYVPPTPDLNEIAGDKPQSLLEFPYFEQLCRPATLEKAFRQLRQGRTVAARRLRGAADKMSLELYERNLAVRLRRLAWRLQSGTYRPHPISQFRLKKPNGGERVLTVFSIEDRILQRAILNLLEPLWEPHFLPCSFAFRPDSSARSALEQVESYYAQGYRWAVDADIEQFFDRIPTALLLGRLSEKIGDRRLMALLKLLLNYTPVRSGARNSSFETEQPEQVTPSTAAEIRNEPPRPWSNFTRRALERGLGWGIERLEGGSGSSADYGYYYRSSSSWPPVGSNNWENDEADEFEAHQAPDDTYERKRRGAALRRIGLDGTLLGLSLARGLLKHGLPHIGLGGKLGLVVKTGAAVGTAGTAGVWALRKLRQRPTLYEVETADYLRDAAFEQVFAKPPDGYGYSPDEAQKCGIAQGSVLSPFLSNVFLHEFDRRLTAKGYKLVRFADDLVILTRSQREAFGALKEASQILADLGLNFKATKTRVCPLVEGFEFLGATLGNKGKWREFPDELKFSASPGAEPLPVKDAWLIGLGRI